MSTSRGISMIAALLAAPIVTLAQSVEGVWTLAEHASETSSPSEPLGLMILSDGYYSRVFVRTNEPRQLLGDAPTPEQQIESWTPFIANSGRYSLMGSTLTFQITVAKVVAAMGTEATAQVEFEGDSLWLTGMLEGEETRQRWIRAN